MPRLGFIRKKHDIMYLILYCMKDLPFAVDFEAITDITTWCDDGFGYFELNEAFLSLVETGHIAQQGKDEKGRALYVITDKGRVNGEIMEKQIPYFIRDRAVRSALRVVKQIRRNASIKTEVIQQGEDTVVRMELERVYAIELRAATDAQVSMLRRLFQKDAERIYSVLLDAIVASDYEEEEIPQTYREL